MSEIDWTKRKVWTAEQIIAEKREMRRKGKPKWGDTAIEWEIKRRIVVAVAAYAYEIENNPIMSDHMWDRIAQEINPKMGTCHPELDEFFASKFSPMTGMWIHDHPDLAGIARIYRAKSRSNA